MELCKNGCGNVYESRELLEILDGIFGVNKARHNKPESIEDIHLRKRIERKVRNKLAQRGKYNAKVNS